MHGRPIRFQAFPILDVESLRWLFFSRVFATAVPAALAALCGTAELKSDPGVSDTALLAFLFEE